MDEVPVFTRSGTGAWVCSRTDVADMIWLATTIGLRRTYMNCLCMSLNLHVIGLCMCRVIDNYSLFLQSHLFS